MSLDAKVRTILTSLCVIKKVKHLLCSKLHFTLRFIRYLAQIGNLLVD
jgi:hypothetical protein